MLVCLFISNLRLHIKFLLQALKLANESKNQFVTIYYIRPHVNIDRNVESITDFLTLDNGKNSNLKVGTLLNYINEVYDTNYTKNDLENVIEGNLESRQSEDLYEILSSFIGFKLFECESFIGTKIKASVFRIDINNGPM
jgi:hypothetical protein